MSAPKGFLLTWSCYGQRLHGDSRGSVDDQNNIYATATVPTNPRLHSFEAARLAHAPTTLSAPMRRSVHQTILAHAALRGWCVHAANVRTTHVHVVVSGPAAAPMKAEGEFKAWATRRLREAQLIGAATRVWTKQGSARWIWNDEGWCEAIAYVLAGQGEPLDEGLPRNSIEWLARQGQ